MQYTIWLVPSEPVYSQLKTIIDKLSQEYDSPTFQPHLTILEHIEMDPSEIKQKLETLNKDLAGLELSLGPISFSTTSARCVFVRVDSTAKLMQLNLDAKKLFGFENDVFMPHISLMYGDCDMKTREKATKQIHISPTTFTVKEFVLVPSNSLPPI